MTEEGSEALESSGDWALEFIVEVANKAHAEIGMTLLVHGRLVSGMVVGAQQYFAGMAEEQRDSGSGSLADAFEHFARELRDRLIEEKDGELRVEYIHMKDARIFEPGVAAIPENRGVWWRARLSSVDAFLMGVLSADA